MSMCSLWPARSAVNNFYSLYPDKAQAVAPVAPKSPVWSYDPRLSDPNFFASLPLEDWTFGPGSAITGKFSSSLPSAISHQSLQGIADFVSGKSSIYDLRPTSYGQLSYKTGDPESYAKYNQSLGQILNYGSKALSAGLINPKSLSPSAAAALAGHKNYLDTGTFSPELMKGIDVAGRLTAWNNPSSPYYKSGYQAPSSIYTPQDFETIRSGSQKLVDQERLYYNELLKRVQSGQIKVDVPKTSLFTKVLTAAPAIAGAAFGGPVGGAIGGALTGGLSGGGWKGALTGAVGGGIAGAGGLGSVLGKTSLGGPMNSITSGLSSIANSNLNPFNYLSGGIQGLFGANPVTMGLGSALSLGGPGALLGGALGGKQGALIGGLGGAGLGLGLDGYLGNLFGGGNPVSGLFGGGGSTGGAAGGTGGSSILGGLLGGSGGLLGGLGGLLAGGVPLALLTNEANKATQTPVNMRSPFSSVTDGVAKLDPTIRNTLLETMGATRNLRNAAVRNEDLNFFTETIGNTRDMLGRASGNENAFIQARVNPLEAQVARQRGQLEQSLGLRGVSGSSFGDQALRSFGLDAERALGDARAQATQEALGFESGLNQLLEQSGVQRVEQGRRGIDFRSGLDQLLAQGGSQLLAQELAALGLSGQNIDALLNRAKLRTDLFGRAASQFGSLLGG